jgi:hypothetical protein
MLPPLFVAFFSGERDWGQNEWSTLMLINGEGVIPSDE